MDALALDGDEGRGYLRKASVRGKHPLTRGSPNGATLSDELGQRPAEYIGGYEQTQGSEPSQYPEEEKTKVIPIVVASELGIAQTGRFERKVRGCRTTIIRWRHRYNSRWRSLVKRGKVSVNRTVWKGRP